MPGEGKAAGKAARIITEPIVKSVGKAGKVLAKDGEKAASKAGSTAAGDALNASEKKALGTYIGTKTLKWGENKPFQVINSMLRGGKVDDAFAGEAKTAAEDLSAALKKLPSHQGTVYRGVKDLPDDVIAKYKPGETVTEDAFTSTSKSPKGSFGGKVQFVIDSKDGKPIRGHGFNHDYDKQDEVLFDKGSKFKVVSNGPHPTKNGVTQIIMREV